MSNPKKCPPDFTLIEAPSCSKKKPKKKKHNKNCKCCTEEEVIQEEAKSITKTAEQLQKNRLKELEQLLDTANLKDIDRTLDIVQQMDQVCAAMKCKCKVRDFSINCNYCKNRYCTKHYLPEVHGCADAVKKDYRKKYLHPGAACPEQRSTTQQKKHDDNSCKLKKRLHELQNSRKKTDAKKCCDKFGRFVPNSK